MPQQDSLNLYMAISDLQYVLYSFPILQPSDDCRDHKDSLQMSS